MTGKMLLQTAGILMLAAGCSDETVTGAPTQEAAAEVRVHGDAPEGTSESRSESPSGESSEVEGSLQVEARVYVQTETGEWLELTGGATAKQTVEASGGDGFQLLARSEVEAQSYHRVRIEFERVEGEFTGGLSLGLGGGSALVTVDVGADERVVVEREVEFVAHAGAVTHLDIDLNTALWAGAASSAGLVAQSAFASAVAVSAH